MGNKVHPIGFRLPVHRTWGSRWCARVGDGTYRDWLHIDLAMRQYILEKHRAAIVANVHIERTRDMISVLVYAARVAMIIGRGGAGIELLGKELSKIAGMKVSVSAKQPRAPDLSAAVLAHTVAFQLEKRVAFKRAIKNTLAMPMKAGGMGVKIRCSGRLAGADIARSEWYKEGRIPMHTLRAKIDYALVEARTSYGIIGVKVWVYTGDK